MTKSFKIPCLTILMISSCFHLTRIYAQGVNKRINSKLENKGFYQLNDASLFPNQRDSAMWVFQLGYFPNYSEVASSGYILGVQYEKQATRIFNKGGYLIFKKTFVSQSVRWKMGISSGPFLVSERFVFSDDALLVKFGTGLIFDGDYLGITNILMIEYEKLIRNNLAISISISQELISLRGFFPLQFTLLIKI